MERTFSSPGKLIDLEEVINTRTPVWDIAGSGDVRVKLDTDVNGQEWYVLSDDRNVDPLYGKVECWAFPHFNGAHYQYSYEPVAFCFKTFPDLLAAYHTERALWGYDVEEYARRQQQRKSERGPFDPFGEDEEKMTAADTIPFVFRKAFAEDETKIVLKPLIELEAEITSGKTAHAAGINHGYASVRLLEPGRFIADLDTTCAGDCQTWTGEGKTQTLAEFIESRQWDDTVAQDIEYKTYMRQAIWFIGDNVDPWDVDRFVWPEHHIESIDVIHASQEQAKLNREASK